MCTIRPELFSPHIFERNSTFFLFKPFVLNSQQETFFLHSGGFFPWLTEFGLDPDVTTHRQDDDESSTLGIA